MPDVNDMKETLDNADLAAVDAESSETLEACKSNVARIRVMLAKAILLLQAMEG